jgi:superoxide dismutase, Cu-Zn family
MRKIHWIVFGYLCLSTSFAYASIKIQMQLVDGRGKSIGTVRADDTIYGLLLTPNLHHLTPGLHGFHIHECPLCGEHAQFAGGHLDLSDAKQHRGPYEGNSHSGDLPVLVVDAKGKSTMPVLAPRLKLSDIVGRALVIKAGGDSFSDTPEKNGGGGTRIACGEIPYH